MAEMLENLVAYLQANADLSALVGAQIAPDVGDEVGGVPGLVYQQISEPRTHYLSGEFDGFFPTRLQFRCKAGTYAEAVSIGNALLAALEGFMGPMGSPATWIYGILPDDPRDDLEAYGPSRVYSRLVDVRILHGG